MKVLLCSTDDIEPGAARAAYRLNHSLQCIGIETQMLVQTKGSDDATVKGTTARSGLGKAATGLRLTLDHLPLKLYPKREERGTYSLQWLPDQIAAQVAAVNPDIVSLQWICKGYMQIETLAKLNKPLVWTLRDMWAFTGGCHYSDECDRYTQTCGSCPQLQSSTDWDLSRWVWQRKRKSWQHCNLTIVALSAWLGQCAAASSLFKNLRVEVIPNGLDLEKYRPIDPTTARQLLGLPLDKKLVLFGAVKATSDKRKGFHLLQSALQELSQSDWRDQIALVVFGASRPPNPPDFGLETHYLGMLNDDVSLALTYSAADLLVAPSIQENLANTVLEAIACGTPCVAFNIGGMPDLIEHQRNGYLAQPYQVNDLTQGIIWVLEQSDRYQKLAHRARQKAEQEFALEIQAQRYLTLFNEILGEGHNQNAIKL